MEKKSIICEKILLLLKYWRVVSRRKSIVLTVTQGCSSTWRAVYLLSTSTSSMDRISSCSRNQTLVRFYSLHMKGNNIMILLHYTNNQMPTQMWIFTLAVSDTLSQYGRGNSSCPISIWSKRTSWSSLLLHRKHFHKWNTALIHNAVL